MISPAGPVAIIPARNEAPRIEAVLTGLRAVLPDLTVLVIDDASSDGTGGVARKAGAWVARHPIHLGYGAALLTGYQFALRRRAAACVQLDADGQHDPASASTLLGALAAGGADVVLGSRFMLRPRTDTVVRRVGHAALQGLSRILGGPSCTDPTTGYRALSRRALEFLVALPLPEDYPDVDVLIAMHRAGLRLREIPISVASRAGGFSMHDGLRPLYYAYKVGLASAIEASRPRRKAGTRA